MTRFRYAIVWQFNKLCYGDTGIFTKMLNKSSDYTQSYIVFLDIRGFKNFVKKHGFKQIKELYNHICPDEKSVPIAMTRATNPDDADEILLRYNRALSNRKIRIMSDGIVVAAPCCYKDSLAVVLDVCNNHQESLYECDEWIFFEGLSPRVIFTVVLR